MATLQRCHSHASATVVSVSSPVTVPAGTIAEGGGTAEDVVENQAKTDSSPIPVCTSSY